MRIDRKKRKRKKKEEKEKEKTKGEKRRNRERNMNLYFLSRSYTKKITAIFADTVHEVIVTVDEKYI